MLHLGSHGKKPFRHAARPSHDVLKLHIDALQPVPHELQEHGLLACKVVIERALAHTAGAADLCDPRGVEAPGGKEPQRSREDPFPRLDAAALHSVPPINTDRSV